MSLHEVGERYSFVNTALLEVKQGPGMYSFIERPGMEKDADYIVWQNDDLPVPDLSNSNLTPHQYRYLHAYNLAATLSAIRSREFPGASRRGVAYPFEYSDKNGNYELNIALMKYIGERTGKKTVSFWEIGGQEGRWQSDLQFPAAYYGNFMLDPLIIDLDLYRRDADNFYPAILKGQNQYFAPTTYVQGDAHELGRILEDLHPNTPDVVAMMNVSEVIFDPFRVMSQAWEMLPVNGIILIGSSHKNFKMPFLVYLDGKPVIGLQENAQGYKYLEENMSRWNKYNENLTTEIPERQFLFDSSGEVHDESIERVTKALYDYRYFPTSNLTEVLTYLGYELRIIRDETFHMVNPYPRGYICALVKREQDENPFEIFQADGISEESFHVKEYVLPQMHYKVNLTSA